MRKFTCLLLAVLLTALLLAGCERTSEPTPPTLSAQTRVILAEPVEPVLYELPSQALATWKDFIREKPALLLFSTHPLLTPIPEERLAEVKNALMGASADEWVRRGRTLTANPLLLPPEAVSAAGTIKLFSEIVVVLPTNKPPEEVDLEDFRRRAITAGFITPAESQELQLKDGVISGTVRDVPLRVAHPSVLPTIARPVIVHVDLGYFRDSYINEVKTPSYDLLYNLATSLKNAAYPVVAATLSFSNQEIGYSLESRFLIRDLSEIIRHPQLLGGNTPASWTLRAKALYAQTMFDNIRATQLTAQAAQATPADASAHYALALDLLANNALEEGFAALDRAVAIDPGYGLEYLTLAERGRQLGQTAKSIELLQKAAAAIPDNPFIRRELAHRLIEASRVKEARPILAELRRLDWSKTFYPDIPPLLEQMEKAAAVDVIVPDSAPTISPAPAKKPVSGMPGFNHGMGGHGH